jgi:hypothetical protein
MGTGITDVIGRPHDFLPPRSDEFQNLEFCLQFRQRVDHKNVVVPEALRRR